MTTFPTQLAHRAAQMIAQTADLVKNAHQRINVLGSQVSSLAPGSWEDITLSGGWANTAGYIPAQARILQAGMSQIVGHIQGGTVSDGTVIGTLTSGYYNTVHAHTFTVNSSGRRGGCTPRRQERLASTAGNLNSGRRDTGRHDREYLNSGCAVGRSQDIAGDLNNGNVTGTAFGNLHASPRA